MSNTLAKIIQQKQQEVLALRSRNIVADRRVRKSLAKSLAQNGLSIIAECKRHSPSKSHLSAISDPAMLIQSYVDGGAAAISVLTDEEFFCGSMKDLNYVAELLQYHSAPILRKDFIIDEVQLLESSASGADAILLIVAALGEKTASLLAQATVLGLEALVEVHDREELDYAVSIGAEIIGINNRNLSSFVVDINTCVQLIKHVPEHIITVAESGIKDLNDIQAIKRAGFDAALIGEALVRHEAPAQLLRQFRGINEN